MAVATIISEVKATHKLAGGGRIDQSRTWVKGQLHNHFAFLCSLTTSESYGAVIIVVLAAIGNM